MKTNDQQLSANIKSLFDLTAKAKELRKKKKEELKCDETASTLEFLQDQKVRSQTFNLTRKLSNGKSRPIRLIVRREQKGTSKTVTGKVLKSFVKEVFEETKLTKSTMTKQVFGQLLMDKIFKFLKEKKKQHERLVYELD